MTPERTFRDDINGLRAWAVVSVILFHFGIPGFDGGFVGVDIFFVISGFLMTGIIIRALEDTSPDGKHSLSLINFYLSRGRRIIPALLVLCMTLLAAGWFFLPASEYRMLGTHSTSALGFLSNIKFWSEAGYFDVASHEKWLLHTWSLSVEWQFYMILPVIMMLVWKIAPGRKVATAAISSILVFSLGLSIFTSHTHPSAAFFMLHTRAWEMLAGGLVYLLADKITFTAKARQWLYFVGFGLLTLSIGAFDSTTVWPGRAALIPVLGTVMVLLSARQNGILSGPAALQRLGDWSYSLYLWHWPLAVIAVYLNLQSNTTAIAALLFLTLILGWVSYRFVETPTRKFSSKLPTYGGIAVFGAVTLLAALPGVGIYLKQGIPGRLDPNVEAIFLAADDRNPRVKECHISTGIDVPGCTYGGSSLGAIVIGDSHAASLVRSVEKALPSENLHVLDWTMGSCPTILGLKRHNDSSYRCGEFLEKALIDQKQLDPSAPLIVINRLSSILNGQNEELDNHTSRPPTRYISRPHNSRSEEFRQEIGDGFVSTICSFAQSRPVYIVLPIPELIKDVPKTMGRAQQIGVPTRVSITTAEYEERHRFALDIIERASSECGAMVLDPTSHLCSEGLCWGDQDGRPIYFDDDHLNERGGEILVPMLRQVFTSSLPAQARTSH